MARDFQIAGEVLVSVKGAEDTDISSLTELGLSIDAVEVRVDMVHRDLKASAWGGVPVDTQVMGATARVRMNLVHYDNTVLEWCERLSLGYKGGQQSFQKFPIGRLPSAGTRLGNNKARFASGNSYIGLNLTCPLGPRGRWRFYYAHLHQTPVVIPLGTDKSVVQLEWRVVPYTRDPWNDGYGMGGTDEVTQSLDPDLAQFYGILWDHVEDV